MFITDKEKLKKYATSYRIWQGIPGIEVTKGGRIFSTFYSGGIKEEAGNFALLVYSDDGETFSEPIAVAYREDYRCFDPNVWIDPLGRLWFIWSLMPDDEVWAVICDNPDADELEWGEPLILGNGVMLNKPTVLSTGEWLFPIALWKAEVKREIDNNAFQSELSSGNTGAFVYRSVNHGKSFEKIGGADIVDRSYDEHMFVEMNDGGIANYIRTFYGIGVSYSYDGGKTWTDGEDSKLGGPCSRFSISRLKSGRILLVNHYKNQGRNNLTALLSEDDGVTWKYSLLLDSRKEVSYPDIKEADDGYIYITYDRERGGFKSSLNEVYSCAREIIYAKITEEDIIKGEIVSPDSKLMGIISKLGRYESEDNNIFNEPAMYSDDELIEFLMEKEPDEIPGEIFEIFNINCINLHKLENRKLDDYIEKFRNETGSKKKEMLMNIISLVKSVSDMAVDDFPIVAVVKRIIMDNLKYDMSLEEIADKACISKYYMMHQFKKITGVSIVKYRTTLKISHAKRLLVSTDKSMMEIASDCGFNNSGYFAEIFMKSENISPTAYRKALKN